MTGDEPDSPTANDPEWTVLDSVREYETGWYTGGYDLVEQPDGSQKKYYWAELQPAVIVVSVKDESIIFVEQYRPAIRKRCLELPAGLLEGDEDFEQAARRELREETGFEALTTTCLETFWVATGILRHIRGVVYATDLRPVERNLDENEFLSVKTIPIDDALEQARTRPVTDATLGGLLLAAADGHLDR